MEFFHAGNTHVGAILLLPEVTNVKAEYVKG
jgi:hypothetical protein